LIKGWSESKRGGIKSAIWLAQIVQFSKKQASSKKRERLTTPFKLMKSNGEFLEQDTSYKITNKLIKFEKDNLVCKTYTGFPSYSR